MQRTKYFNLTINDFLKDLFESWVYHKRKLLFYQNILDTLSDIANKGNANGLNLKVLKLDCGSLNNRDEIIFFQLHYWNGLIWD